MSTTIFASVAVHIAAAAACGAMSGAFTVISLPDTQNYSESYPEIFSLQTGWIAQNIDALDIRFVSHFGDVVNHGDSIDEWTNADLAMSTLDDSGIPYGVCAGNHDITPSGGAGTPYIPMNFVEYFGPGRFEGRAWYGGASPQGTSSYQLFEAGGIEFLALSLECDATLTQLAWAQGILNANRDKPVLLTTHRYLQDAEDYTGGVPIVPSGRYPDVWYNFEGLYVPNGSKSEQIFDWFIRRNPNIFLVQCGHFHEEFRQTSVNVLGQPVHEVLADYQDDPNGGNGWLRILRFDVAAQTIDVDSYSPLLDAYRSEDESDFTLDVQFDQYFETNPTVVLQQGISGYTGTQDTWISEANPNSSYGDAATRISDDDVTNSFFSDKQGQALIRFDGLIGEGGVPAGASILSAAITLQLSDDIDTPLFTPDFFVHQVLVPWSEASTWNSLGNGLQVGSDLGPVLAVMAGDNDPDGDGLRRLDVTAAVQAWASGEPNWGIAILPEIIPGNDDGIEILSSESSNPLLRPAIEVVFKAPEPANPADLNGDGAVNSEDLGILLAAWGVNGAADINGDGIVDGADLAVVLAAWTE
jgi:hypothetical protein